MENIKYAFKGIFLLLILYSCMRKHLISHEAIDFAISEVWSSDTCALDKKAILVEHLLENTIEGLDSTKILTWFDRPIHKRYFKNGSAKFVYPFAGHPRSITCKYGDLFCIEFDSEGRLKRNYLFFITEDDETTEFWYSDNLPLSSYEGINENKYYKNLP